MEGISYGLLDGFELLAGLGATAEEIRITSGGAKSRFWVQMLADMFGRPCATLECDEGPAYGAAILAGVGAGVWPDVVTACEKVVRVRERTEPSGVQYLTGHSRYRSLYAATGDWNRANDA
jgi:xylulokinase